jgi:N-acetylmuramoyl-L-alanine amidase CwlA
MEKGHFPIVGKRFSPSEFLEYCLWVKENERFSWSPKGVTIHHTAFPHLAMRPDGFKETHMQNLRAYYKDQLGWNSGPHIFTDDNGIWVHTPLSHKGVHARSFNSTHIGIEMLGDFDYKDDPDEGRGKKSTDNGKIAAAAILIAFGLNPANVNFHRDDPKTSKTCPGRKIKKQDFVADVNEIYSSIKKT